MTNKTEIFNEFVALTANREMCDVENVAGIMPKLLPLSDSLSERERALMFDIIHRIVKDIEFDLRRDVAKTLAERDDVPVELIHFLAKDEAEIAFPVLSLNPLLTDDFLKEIIALYEDGHQLAITKRTELSQDVAGALVEHGSEVVLLSALNNPGVHFSQHSMDTLAVRCRESNVLCEPLLKRKEVSNTLAVTMLSWISVSLRQYVVEHFEVDAAVLNKALEEAALLEMPNVRGRLTPEALAALRGETLNTEQLLDLLDRGEVRFFTSVLVDRSGISLPLILRALFDVDPLPLAVVCKAAEFGKAEFASIFAKIRQLKPATKRMLDDELRQTMRIYDRFNRASAMEVAVAWHNFSDFHQALSIIRLR